MKQSHLSSIQLADGSEEYIVQPIVRNLNLPLMLDKHCTLSMLTGNAKAYHMLHCLYTIYKYAHPDFYGEDPDGPEWVVTHTDHCVDNLRQVYYIALTENIKSSPQPSHNNL